MGNIREMGKGCPLSRFRLIQLLGDESNLLKAKQITTDKGRNINQKDSEKESLLGQLPFQQEHEEEKSNSESQVRFVRSESYKQDSQG